MGTPTDPWDAGFRVPALKERTDTRNDEKEEEEEFSPTATATEEDREQPRAAEENTEEDGDAQQEISGTGRESAEAT
ncbi:hypothetical protein NDU88_003821 [Pleurodeles waltl]|uniref:Uncharacterized protein n=1 Tax=Pleurodeles waltl TaxID=8319 RepID=A0AAV7PEY3_PLEWA|nr:hypothetical protein NDU88_003821 [Pleurodeles waltl]